MVVNTTLSGVRCALLGTPPSSQFYVTPLARLKGKNGESPCDVAWEQTDFVGVDLILFLNETKQLHEG